MPSVTIVRKGQPVQIDKQVYSYCLRRKRQRRKLRGQRLVISNMLDHFGGDSEKAQNWFESTIVRPYGISAQEMLVRGNLVALRRYVKCHLKLDILQK
jgi:hypothetical protein